MNFSQNLQGIFLKSFCKQKVISSLVPVLDNPGCVSFGWLLWVNQHVVSIWPYVVHKWAFCNAYVGRAPYQEIRSSVAQN